MGEDVVKETILLLILRRMEGDLDVIGRFPSEFLRVDVPEVPKLSGVLACKLSFGLSLLVQ